MRKSERLASIFDDDNVDVPDQAPTSSSSESSNDLNVENESKTKKFVPTIPGSRRKKALEDPASTTPVLSTATPLTKRPVNPRQPFNGRSDSVLVSGPLAMGPASMAPSSSRSSSSSAAGISARSLPGISNRISVSTGASSSSSSSNPASPLSSFENSTPMEREFGCEVSVLQEDLLNMRPIAVSSESASSKSELPESFDPEKLYLFQMPPILPTIISPTSPTEPVDPTIWPNEAVGSIGKLRRHKSGRMTLFLNNGVEFTVNPSVSSVEETQLTSLLAIDPDNLQSFNLGPIAQQFTCAPDFAKFQKL